MTIAVSCFAAYLIIAGIFLLALCQAAGRNGEDG